MQRFGHSTETVLNAVHKFITIQLDDGRNVPLFLLDLSSKFDEVNPTILPERLQYMY